VDSSGGRAPAAEYLKGALPTGHLARAFCTADPLSAVSAALSQFPGTNDLTLVYGGQAEHCNSDGWRPERLGLANAPVASCSTEYPCVQGTHVVSRCPWCRRTIFGTLATGTRPRGGWVLAAPGVSFRAGPGPRVGRVLNAINRVSPYRETPGLGFHAIFVAPLPGQALSSAR
jgi:hypothetical protein